MISSSFVFMLENHFTYYERFLELLFTSSLWTKAEDPSFRLNLDNAIKAFDCNTTIFFQPNENGMSFIWNLGVRVLSL